MQKVYTLLILLSIIIKQSSEVNTNDLSLSMSTSMANNLNALLAQKYIPQLISSFSLPPLSQIITPNPYLQTNVTLSHFHLFNFQNHFTTQLQATQDKALQFTLANLTTQLSFDFQIQILSIDNNNNNNTNDNNNTEYDKYSGIAGDTIYHVIVNLQELEFKIKSHMIFDTKQKSNLSLSISDNYVNYNHVDVNVQSSEWFNSILNFILNNDLFKNNLGSLLSKQIMGYVNHNVLNQHIHYDFQLPMSDTIYSIRPLFYDKPEVLTGTSTGYLAAAMGIRVTNNATGVQAPLIPFYNRMQRLGPLSDSQVLMSSNLIHQIAWMVSDSNILTNFLISDKQVPTNSPIHLYTDQLVVLLPQLLIKYGNHKGVYIQVNNLMTKGTTVVNGRLVIELNLLFTFIVDPVSSDYPQSSLTQCPQCQQALTFQLNINLAINVANVSPSLLRPLLLSASLQSISNVSTILPDFNLDTFQQLFQQLIQSIIPLANQQFVQGINNPLMGYFNINNMQIRFTQDLILISIQTAQNKTQ